MLKLSIIIINFNGERFLENCLDSIFQNPPKSSFEVIVLDNASKDQSCEILRRYPHPIQLIESTENLGFSRGNNRAATHAKGDYFLLLNNDTVVHPNALDRMLAYIDAHPEVGALSPKLLNADGSIQAQGSVFGAWRYYAKKPTRVPFIIGAAMLTPRSFYTEIGGLDENLFFYNDDIDYCKQVLRRKKYIIYLPEAEVTHFGGLSTATRKASAIVDGYRGSFYLSKKFYPLPIHFLHRILTLIEVLPKLTIATIFGIFSKLAREKMQAYCTILGIAVSGKFLPEKKS